jgi:ABC-type dipeptide/oligopeptide/nickel transport system permease subunit
MSNEAVQTMTKQPASKKPQESRSELWLGLRQLIKNPLAAAGLVVIVLFILIAAFGPFLPVADPLKQHMNIRAATPSSAHWLGTDQLGRDVLARLIYATRASLLISGGAVLLALGLGVPLGLCAGYFGKWIDSVIMRLTDAILSFPAIILAIALVASLGTGIVNVMIAIGLVNMPVFARLVRASALLTKAEDYVLASRSVGVSNARIMIRHILPSSIAPVTVQIGASFAVALIAEATLSFLGLGVQAPNPSWGMMLNDARDYLSDAPWLALFPSACISLAVLAVNFVGDGLRDALDPRYRDE